MTEILTITFPIYAAISIGYLVVHRGWFSAADMRGFGRYVLNIALPALLFEAVASRDLGAVFVPGYVLAYGLGGLATILVAFLWFSVTAPDRPRRAIAVMGSSCPNSGFIGYPLILLSFPDLAGPVLAMNMMVELLVLIPVCLILVDMAGGEAQTPVARRILGNLLGVLRRPMVIGLLLGLAVSALELPLPRALDTLSGMIAASASALSLIVIGGSLVGVAMRGNRALAGQIAGAKLLLHPALVFLVLTALPMFGIAPLSSELFAALILSAAISMFGIYTVLAQENGLEGLASIAMLITTGAAFVTLSLLLLVLT